MAQSSFLEGDHLGQGHHAKLVRQLLRFEFRTCSLTEERIAHHFGRGNCVGSPGFAVRLGLLLTPGRAKGLVAFKCEHPVVPDEAQPLFLARILDAAHVCLPWRLIVAVWRTSRRERNRERLASTSPRRLLHDGAADAPMQPQQFADRHLPALEADEARHNLMLWIISRMMAGLPDVRVWTLGSPGQCAVQTPPRPILLADLDQAQCRRLAEQTVDLGSQGVVGPDGTAAWFAERAGQLGIPFQAPIPQQIQALHSTPTYPGAPGRAFMVGNDHASLFADWIIAFTREATPQDPVPDRAHVMRSAGDGRYMFWVEIGR